MKPRSTTFAACLALLVAALTAAARPSTPPHTADAHRHTQPFKYQLSGHWTGYITQAPFEFDSIYHFDLRVTSQGDSIIGTTRIISTSCTDIWGRMRVTGKVQGTRIILHETSVIQDRMRHYTRWCLKHLHLIATVKRRKHTLTGTWTSDDCGPTSGRILLERKRT